MRAWLCLAVLAGCGSPPFVAITFNTGTSAGPRHELPPEDGYGATQAEISDRYYGDGLAWSPVIDDTRRFFERVRPDIVGFQEMFYSGDCPSVPADARAGWACERWKPGDPSVVQVVLGAGYQVACHLGKTDKCIGVRREFGTLRGCGGDLCLDGLAGAPVPDCGSGSRVGRGVIDLADGRTLTVINVHGTSGLSESDQRCRVGQLEQVFRDFPDGERNLILGDFNTDPGRNSDFDVSARYMNEHAGPGKRFGFISAVGPDAPGSYTNLFDIDHVLSDVLRGSCVVAGIDAEPAVSAIVYFDHKPQICTVSW